MEASSPPYVRYDPSLVEKLHKAGVLAKNDARELYRCHFGRDPKGSLISGRQRIRIIFREVTSHFNLDGAKAQGLIVDWYPVHSKHWIDRLNVTWANFSNIFDLSLVQPTPFIQEYFGERVAFSFAWNGTYCKCLLALLPVAVVVSAMVLVADLVGLAGTSDRQVIGFSIILALWSKLASNMWHREQDYFLKLFDINPHSKTAIPRPQFLGYPVPAAVDENETDLVYPWHLAMMRQLLSGFTTLVYSVFVGFMIVAWVDRSLATNGRMTIEASIFLTIQIKVFEMIYNYLAVVLTEWENHKYQETYYDSYLWKQIFFQSVNYYTPFFYLTVMQRQTDVGCPVGGCLAALRKSLTITLAIISVCRLLEVVGSALWVKFSLWREERSLAENGAPTRTFEEQQAMYGEFRTREQIEAMLQLVLSLGYVLIFGAVAPIAVAFCFVVFIVQLRASAHLLTSTAKRPVPRRQVGIGAWQEVVGIIMKVGVLFEGFLLVSVGDSFADAKLLAKLTGFILFGLGIFLAWALVDRLFPNQDSNAELLAKRRQYTQEKIMHKSGHVQQQKGGVSRQASTESAAIGAYVENGDWGKIPHRDGSAVVR